MRNGLYPRLAAVNLRKNRQTWLPYLYVCRYHHDVLHHAHAFERPSTYEYVRRHDAFGHAHLRQHYYRHFFRHPRFYANSFIIKQRKREFGLYNILGMNKRHIGRVLLWETLYTALISFVCGIALGILFSKLMQLLLLRILRFDIRFGLYVSPLAIGITAVLFAAIFS